MSLICQKLESAIIRWLAYESVWSVGGLDGFALVTKLEGSTIINTGLRAKLGAEEFTVNLYAGQSEGVVTLPAVVVAVTDADEVPNRSGNYWCRVDITLEYQGQTLSGSTSVLGAIEASNTWLDELLSHDDLHLRLSKHEANFACQWIEDKRSGRSVGGQRRIAEYGFRAYCSNSSLFVGYAEEPGDAEAITPAGSLDLASPDGSVWRLAALLAGGTEAVLLESGQANPYLDLLAADGVTVVRLNVDNTGQIYRSEGVLPAPSYYDFKRPDGVTVRLSLDAQGSFEFEPQE